MERGSSGEFEETGGAVGGWRGENGPRTGRLSTWAVAKDRGM